LRYGRRRVAGPATPELRGVARDGVPKRGSSGAISSRPTVPGAGPPRPAATHSAVRRQPPCGEAHGSPRLATQRGAIRQHQHGVVPIRPRRASTAVRSARSATSVTSSARARQPSLTKRCVHRSREEPFAHRPRSHHRLEGTWVALTVACSMEGCRCSVPAILGSSPRASMSSFCSGLSYSAAWSRMETPRMVRSCRATAVSGSDCPVCFGRSPRGTRAVACQPSSTPPCYPEPMAKRRPIPATAVVFNLDEGTVDWSRAELRQARSPGWLPQPKLSSDGC